MEIFIYIYKIYLINVSKVSLLFNNNRHQVTLIFVFVSLLFVCFIVFVLEQLKK
jgi:hypothetical protein